MGDVRSYVSGNFFFQIDGVKCGFIKSVDGGAISAEVINEPVGPMYFVKKHIGQPKYEDFTLQIGFSMSKAVYDWIAASWQMNYQRKNGAIIACDYKLDAKSQREFFNALITETGIPACDGSSKEPAYLTLKFAPEYTRYTKASGKAAGELGKSEQKLWLPSNFRLTIDGMDCTKVAKIDAFTVKQTAVTDDLGDARDYLKEPGKLEFPNLKITLAEVAAQGWYDWHEDFVIKGNNDEGKEKNGVLEFLSPNRQDVLLTIKMFNLGIFKITTDKSEANADQIKRVSSELYCERMELQFGKGTVA
jgi:phage tail-like protein